ncbi:MAG: hypothetical protein HY066_14585 [Betaproteobacteria bacterium]|nr:hypothetical protein [Betaproteobacteria bacterium]
MQTKTKFFASAILLSVQAHAASTLPCPPMPAAVTDVSRDVKSDIGVSVGSLGRVKAGELGVKTETVANNLFGRFPNVDRLLALQMMASTYCGMLNALDIPNSEKLSRWERFQDKVLSLQSSAEMPQQAPQNTGSHNRAAPPAADVAPAPVSDNRGAITPPSPQPGKPAKTSPDDQKPYVKILSASCERLTDKLTIFRFKGRARMPVGASLSASPTTSQGWKPMTMVCPDWSQTPTNSCQRMQGEKPEGNWTGTYRLDGWAPYKNPGDGKVNVSASAFSLAGKQGVGKRIAEAQLSLKCE